LYQGFLGAAALASVIACSSDIGSRSILARMLCLRLCF
jgi:hypothetical protein